jgi:hypothetical protein
LSCESETLLSRAQPPDQLILSCVPARKISESCLLSFKAATFDLPYLNLESQNSHSLDEVFYHVASE